MKLVFKWCLLIISLVIISTIIYKICFKIYFPLHYEENIRNYSQKYNLDEYMVMGLIRVESNFIYDATSSKKARGLMQITDDTQYWISKKIDKEIENIHDPDSNIQLGCYYLRYLLDYYNNNTTSALAAYNAGMGNVDKWLKDKNYSSDGKNLDKIPYLETKKYIDKIYKYMGIYKKIYSK